MELEYTIWNKSQISTTYPDYRDISSLIEKRKKNQNICCTYQTCDRKYLPKVEKVIIIWSYFKQKLMTKSWFPNFYINWLLVVGGRWRIVKPPYQTSFFFVCFCRCISKTIFRGHLWPPTTWPSWQQGRSGHDTQWPLLPWRGLIYYSRPTPSSESGLCTLGWTQWLYMSCVIASSNPRYTN